MATTKPSWYPVIVQLAQLILACRAWRKVGRPVDTMVLSSDDMNNAIDTIPKITHREVGGRSGERDPPPGVTAPDTDGGITATEDGSTADLGRRWGGPSLDRAERQRLRETCAGGTLTLVIAASL